MTVMVNPVIEPLDDATSLGWEGCLSVPGLAGMVPRHDHIRYRFQTLTGETVEREAQASTPAWCSTNATTWTACSTRSAWMTWSPLVFTEELKHGAATQECGPQEEETVS